MTYPLLEQCRALGIRLAADGDNLAIDAPAGSLTPELLAEIRQNKSALLAAIQNEPTGGGPTTPQPATAPEPETATSGEGEPVHLTADDFDGLPEPGKPCPVCGSLDVLWGLLGETTCQRCNSDKLARSLKLAERAARLRQAGMASINPKTLF